jgi:hypothetical protein
MKPVDYDLHGGPIYDPLDLMAQAALLPVFYPRRMSNESDGGVDALDLDVAPGS